MHNYLPCGCSNYDFELYEPKAEFLLYITNTDIKPLSYINNRIINDILYFWRDGYSRIELSQADIERIENINLTCLTRVQFDAVENILRQIREVTEQ